MKHECDRIGDATWEHVRFGTELPPDAERHIARCPDCARAMKEAGSLSGLLQTAASVPQAPDCTEAVMSRISAGVRRPVWAYAVTSALLVVLLIGVLMALRPHGRPAQIARQVVPPQATPYQPPAAKGQDVRPAIQPRENGIQRKPLTAQYRQPRVRHRVHPKLMVAVTNTQQQSPVPRVPEQIAEERRPIMAVSVTWGAEPSESSSYAYTERNEETGETTTCTVVKSPGVVSIFMECKPSGQEPPSKGA